MTVSLDVFGNFLRLFRDFFETFKSQNFNFKSIESNWIYLNQLNHFEMIESMLETISIILWIVFWQQNSFNLWILQRSQEQEQQQFSNLKDRARFSFAVKNLNGQEEQMKVRKPSEDITGTQWQILRNKIRN